MKENLSERYDSLFDKYRKMGFYPNLAHIKARDLLREEVFLCVMEIFQEKS